MSNKSLLLALLLSSKMVMANDKLAAANADNKFGLAALRAEQQELTLNTLAVNPSMASYRGGGQRDQRVIFFFGFDIGYSSATTKNSNFPTTSGGGLMGRIEAGVKVTLPNEQIHKRMVNISLCYEEINVKQKYKDATGQTQTRTNPDVVLYVLPLSYLYMRNGSEGSGYYWQGGINLGLVHEVKDQDKQITSLYSNVFVEPFISAGVHIPFTLMRGGNEVGHRHALIGPVFSYIANNMILAKGSTMNGWTLALRYHYLFL
jgi:hypothetical protein